MDILTELFRDAGLHGRVLELRTVPAEQALRFPCDRSVGFHVVLRGEVFVHTDRAAAPLRLAAGDVAFMGRGCTHLLAAHEGLEGLPVATIGTGVAKAEATDSERGGAGARVVSGAYQLWHTPVHPFFAELPDWHVIRRVESPRLEPLGLLVALLAEEARDDALGRDTVVQGLLDALFVRLVRAIVEREAGGVPGWAHAVADPHVRRAVERMHADPAAPWSVDTLAREAGLARTAFATRFRDTMRVTPLAYLRSVRLQRAMRLLVEEELTLDAVATRIGYGDAFAFSKAFKRAAAPSRRRSSSRTRRTRPSRSAASAGAVAAARSRTNRSHPSTSVIANATAITANRTGDAPVEISQPMP